MDFIPFPIFIPKTRVRTEYLTAPKVKERDRRRPSEHIISAFQKDLQRAYSRALDDALDKHIEVREALKEFEKET